MKKCMICGGKARPKKNTCVNCSGKVNLLKEDKVPTKRIEMVPHFETLPKTRDLWPEGRLFYRGEFLEGLEYGTWPAGMRVKDEKGHEFEVRLELRRI